MALRINGQLFTDDDIYDEMEKLKAAAQSGPNPPNCCEQDDEYMGYARDTIIARALLRKEADRMDVTVPPDKVDESLEQLKEQHGGEEWFYMTFNTSKESEGEFKEQLADDLRVQAAMDQLVGDIHEPTDDEVEAYYHEHLDDFMAPQQVRARHILKDLDHGADREQAFNDLHEARKRALAGEDFATLSDELSDKSGEGGDLGYFGRGELVEEFEAVIFSMEPGEISPVFLTQFGYHVAKLEDRKAREPYPLDDIRDDIRKYMVDEQRNERSRAVVEELKSKATIEEIDEDGDDADAVAAGDVEETTT